MSHRQQNETDCKFFNEKLLVLYPSKCSYSVRLGKHMPGKIRPIKLMFKTPVERDTACFFLMSETASIKATYPLFKVSHDRTTIELLEKKKYDALKQELKSKLDTGKTNWNIKRNKHGLTLVNKTLFVKPQIATRA